MAHEVVDLTLSDGEDEPRRVRARLSPPAAAPASPPNDRLHINGGYRLVLSSRLQCQPAPPAADDAEVLLCCERAADGGEFTVAVFLGAAKRAHVDRRAGGLTTPEPHARQQRLGTLTRVAAAKLYAALSVGAPLVRMRATVRGWDWRGSRRPLVWLTLRAPADAPAELVDQLRAVAGCSCATDASEALKLGAALDGAARAGANGRVCQPIGTHTAEWARAHLPSSIRACDAPYVNLGGAALPPAARAQQPAGQHRLLVGKWLVFALPAELDELWVAAATALHEGKLGCSIEAVACGPLPEYQPAAAPAPAGSARAARLPLFVYCSDFTDERDCRRVGLALGAALRLVRGSLSFTPDVFTQSEGCVFKSIFSLNLLTGEMRVHADALRCARAMAGLDLNCSAPGGRVEGGAGARGGPRAVGAAEPPVPPEPESDWESASEGSSRLA